MQKRKIRSLTLMALSILLITLQLLAAHSESTLGFVAVKNVQPIGPLQATTPRNRFSTPTSYDLSAHDKNNDKIEDRLEDILLAESQSAEIWVIVEYSAKPTESDLELINQYGVVEHVFRYLNAASALVEASSIRRLASSADIRLVWADTEVHVTLDTSVDVVHAPEVWGFLIDGSGIVIAIIDTGIDDDHVDLSGRVVGWRDFVNGIADPYDDHGHGTHCASIAAGTGAGSGGLYTGVAPGASLVGVKVFDAWGNAPTSRVIQGIEWCVTNKDVYDIKIISYSAGAAGSSDGNDPCSRAVDNAVDAGLVAVVAAGNEGPGAYTIGSPGASRKAITVGAVDNSMDIALFSSRGPTADERIKPDVCAVGVDVMAAEAGSHDGYVSWSGTSMSTPMVAGVCALMLQVEPDLSPDEVKDYLMLKAVDRGDPGAENTYGSGVAHAFQTLARDLVLLAADSREAGLEDASVEIELDGTVIFSGQADGEGWIGAMLLRGSYALRVSWKQVDVGAFTLDIGSIRDGYELSLLAPCDVYYLEITVISLLFGQPLSNQEARVYSDSELFTSKNLDGNGKATFRLPKQDYRIEVTAEYYGIEVLAEYITSDTSVTVDADKTQTIRNIVLSEIAIVGIPVVFVVVFLLYRRRRAPPPPPAIIVYPPPTYPPAAPPPTPAVVHCPNCGAELAPGAVYCLKCGRRVE